MPYNNKQLKNILLFLIVLLISEIIFIFYFETYKIEIKKQKIKDMTLSHILQNLKVIQISDLQIKKYGVLETQLVRLINKIDPDIIFITGDLISDSNAIHHLSRFLKNISKNNRYIIAVPGNSDHVSKGYMNDDLLIKDVFRNKNLFLLVNETIKIEITRDNLKRDLYIIGLDDNFTWNDNFYEASISVPNNAPKILLAHAPNIIEKIDTKNISLILSGHTHGGQIVLPFWGPLITNQVCNAKKEYIAGLYNEKGTKLYVNRGIGTSHSLSIRLLSRPEITIFEFI